MERAASEADGQSNFINVMHFCNIGLTRAMTP
jgi:hypothetical protein